MSVPATLLVCGLVVVVATFALWLISLWKRDASIADAFWGTGFIVVTIVAWRLQATISHRDWLIVVLIVIWGLRLSIHLLVRNLRHGEDRRYADMRAHQGARFWWISLFTVFWLQGAVLWFVSLPIQVALSTTLGSQWNAFDLLGILAYCVGLYFEVVGDWQLTKFKSNSANQGRVLDSGLWRYTRHPNYFGDFCIWWGVYAIACSTGAAWTIASPILMSWLLVKVSGVSLLESDIRARLPHYQDYMERTNAFIPGRPR